MRRVVLGPEIALVDTDLGEGDAGGAVDLAGLEDRDLAAIGLAARGRGGRLGVGDVLGDDAHARLLRLQRAGRDGHGGVTGRDRVRHRLFLDQRPGGRAAVRSICMDFW